MASPIEALAAHAPAISTKNTRVNVHCNACEAYLGIFENEWIRLTTSYARPAQEGIRHATEISDKTRVVPTETGQRSAEGCTLSDVVCQQCSSTVGQYCREAPTPEKQHLVGVYFYKLSKVTLKAPNQDLVGPIFVCDDSTPEIPGSPVPSVIAPDPKWSHPPPVKSLFRNVYRTQEMMPPPSRSSRTPGTARSSQAPRSSARPRWQLPRMADGDLSVRGSSVASQRRRESLRLAGPAGTSEGLLALRRVLQQDIALSKMTSMMESMRHELHELRASGRLSQTGSADERTPAEDEELKALKAENEAMKKVLRTLPAQMQFENPRYSQSHDNPFGTPESGSTNPLGKRKRNSEFDDNTSVYDDDGVMGEYDDFHAPVTEVSGLATLEQDAAQGYSVWQGAEDGSEGTELSDGNEDGEDDNSQSRAFDGERPHSDVAVGERHSGRSRERRQTLPADFIAEEQRYLLSDSNDENFDPNDPKVKGRKHKRTRSAERRRRERLERQQDSLWKKGVPGGGYENGDGWVEQKRHHSGRFGRKAAVGDGLAVYPKYVNDKLFANGRQIPTTHKRLARELVYLGLDDWIDKDKSDPLYRRTIRVARKHYAYHHGGISSKALCQGKYTRKDLEQVGMWDDELFEEINMGEESDVEKLDFPLDPALQRSIEQWKKEGVQAKERRKKAAQDAAAEACDHSNDPNQSEGAPAEEIDANRKSQILDISGMTEFSDEDVAAGTAGTQLMPQVPDRVERHTKFDAIWQVPHTTGDNPVLSIIQHAEARIKAAEEEMGEPTFKSKKAQKFRTIGQSAALSSRNHAKKHADLAKNPGVEHHGERAAPMNANTTMTRFQKPITNAAMAIASADVSKATSTRTVAEHLEALDLLAKKDQNSFLRELRAYFAVDKETGDQLSTQEHITLTDEQLKDYAANFLETRVVRVGGSKKIGLEYWPEDGSRKLNYATNKQEIIKDVYGIFVIQRYNKARVLRRQLNKDVDGETMSLAKVVSDAALASSPHLVAAISHNVKAMLSSFRSSSATSFDDGLRYNFERDLNENTYDDTDGKPRTVDNAASLPQPFEQVRRGRASLPVNGLSDHRVLEQGRAQRRATMLSTSVAQSSGEDLSVIGPSIRQPSILGDSILQMASAMKQLAQAFEDPVEQIDLDNVLDEDDVEMNESTEIEDSARLDTEDTFAESVSGAEVDAITANGAISSGDVGHTNGSLVPAHGADIDGLDENYTDVVEDTLTTEVTPGAETSDLELESTVDPQAVPAFSTRSAARARELALPAQILTKDITQARQPVAIMNQKSSTSLSDKENTTPVPYPGTGDTEPPAKKLKTMAKRGRGRPPRKSASELDQLAKEAMDRETRSSMARRSRSGLYFGSSSNAM